MPAAVAAQPVIADRLNQLGRSLYGSCFEEVGERRHTENVASPVPGLKTRPTPEDPAYNRRMKTVAVIGASSNRDKFGNKALRAFEKRGYRVIPINPTEATVEGHRTFKSVMDVPENIDMATV